MSILTSTYGLSVGDLIKAKVRAYNERGWGLQSIANSVGILAQTVPQAVALPTTDDSITGETQVFVQWAELTTNTEIGGSAITSYHLQTDKATTQLNGSPTWSDVKGGGPESLTTSETLTSDITAGYTYRFRVRASNLHGWGEYSAIASIKAAQIPY